MLFSAIVAASALTYNNGLGATPQMGWNSWNSIGGNIDEAFAKSIGDGLVSSGLAAIGYVYVCLDDGVMLPNRSADGKLIADPSKFTNGSLATLAAYLHSKQLKLGVYSSGGTVTCMHRAGTHGHEKIDAETWAQWGVVRPATSAVILLLLLLPPPSPPSFANPSPPQDYAKLDWCGNVEPAKTWYPKMSKALNDTGRHIFFAMCEWGDESVWQWGSGYANSWRTWRDICNYWTTNSTVNPYCAGVSEVIQQNQQYHAYGRPYGWNVRIDPAAAAAAARCR